MGGAGRQRQDPRDRAMSRTFDRRTLLRGAVATGVVASAGGLGLRALLREPPPWDETAFPPPGDARVAVLGATSYAGRWRTTVLDGLRAIGADVRGANVLLKPNLVEFDATTAINTEPRLIAATVLACRRLGASSVRVAEGPGPPKRRPGRGRAVGTRRRARGGRRAVRRPEPRSDPASHAPIELHGSGRAVAAHALSSTRTWSSRCRR